MEPIASVPILSKSSGSVYTVDVFNGPHFTCSFPAGENAQMWSDLNRKPKDHPIPP
jgi:hypothetical protein